MRLLQFDDVRDLKRRIRRRLQFGMASIPLKILADLPLDLAIRTGGTLGAMAWSLLPRERSKVIERMRRCLSDGMSDAEIIAAGRRSFINLGKSLAEVTHIRRLREERLLDRIDAIGESHLEQAWLKGAGVILVTGHIGNWEYLACYYAQRGYPLTVLARENPVPGFDRLLTGLRFSAGFRPLNRGTVTAAKESLKALRKGQLLGLLIDQDTKVDGVFVDFFGRPAWTPVGAASLALRTGSPIMMTYIIRGADDRHTIHVSPPIQFESCGDRKKDPTLLTALLTRELESIIRAHPDHWVWMHNRWKTRPAQTGKMQEQGGMV